MTRRALTPDDLGHAVELLRADEEQLVGRPARIGLADLREWLSRVDLEGDTWLFEEDGSLAAFGWGETQGAQGWAAGVVHPDSKRQGLGALLLDCSERRLPELGAKRVHQFSYAADRGAAALFVARGYREVRRFYEMAIELDGPPDAAELPSGFTIESFDESRARKFHGALDESFQDHWEHHSVPFEAWWEQKRSVPDYDPSLWFVIRADTELAAAVRNEPNRRDGGMVAALGVRRPWRGRGLGRALLLHTFGEFHRRGVTRITLGVDSENPTGATKLYESVGMQVELEQVIFERALA
jgi:mycothiol synthase